MGDLGPLRRSRWQLGAAVVAVTALGAIGMLPLFAGPGYEAALAAGLVLPSVAAVATALEIAERRAPPWNALTRGLASGAALGALGYAVALLHGLRVGFCDPLEDSLRYWLGGGAGAVVGGAWGAVVGVLVTAARRRRRWLAVGGALAGPAAGVGISLWRFYATPMVYAYDSFFGFFAGTLYDTELEGLGPLATYRAGTALALTALVLVAAALERGERWPRWIQPRPRGVLGVAALATLGAIGHALAGPELGHWSTSASIARTLGHRRSGVRCEVVHSGGVAPESARLVLRDCESHVAELESFFGAPGPALTRVFLFASAAEKGHLTGASRTQIAKPWRAEIYLVQAPYPHPVLRHELAHVVAGTFGSGPFRIAGRWGGLLPDPGRIEGLAEAAAPDDDGDLTDAQWARAMRDLGQLPPLGRVFQLGFLGYGASRAYTTAGAFVGWLVQTRGMGAVRRWYGGEPLPTVAGADLATLEQEWLRSLDSVPVPERALPAARARFDRPAIFDRRCPRVVDRLERVAGEALGADEPALARDRYAALLALDPGHLRARLAMGTCALRAGQDGDARAALDRLIEDPSLGAFERDIARERRGDLALLLGDVAAARADYAAVAATVFDTDRLRTLDVKAALAPRPRERRAVVELLLGARDRGPDFALAAARLGEWAGQDPDDGTPLYLLGKNLCSNGRFAEAADYLDRALKRRLALPRVLEETWRVRLIAACALGDTAGAGRALAGFLALPTASMARREGTRAVARRCGVTVP